MNIQKRIERLEKETGLNSDYCVCKERRHGCANLFVVSNDFDVSNTTLEEARRVQYCETCRKEIDKLIIIINDVDGVKDLEDDKLALIVAGDSRAKASHLTDNQLEAILRNPD